MNRTCELYSRIYFYFSIILFFRESAIPSNEDENATNTVKSERIVLSSKLAADCPFFL
jgi:hypothetical protein